MQLAFGCVFQEKKPEVLRRQDEGFEKDAQEADKFLNEALRQADSLNNNQ